MVVAGRHHPLSRSVIAKTVGTVLDGERRRAAVSVNFIGPARIRRLNAEWQGHDRPTDVLAFSLKQPGREPLGDVYVCPAVARAQAKSFGVPLREELLRLVIHGTLHVLGHDHPAGRGWTQSTMWRKQERYLGCVV